MYAAWGFETAITGTSGRSIVETTSSARTIERSLADVATVDTLTLTRGGVSIVSNQLSVEIRFLCSSLFSLFVNQKYSSALSKISLRVFRHFAIGFSQNTKIVLLR